MLVFIVLNSLIRYMYNIVIRSSPLFIPFPQWHPPWYFCSVLVAIMLIVVVLLFLLVFCCVLLRRLLVCLSSLSHHSINITLILSLQNSSSTSHNPTHLRMDILWVDLPSSVGHLPLAVKHLLSFQLNHEGTTPLLNCMLFVNFSIDIHHSSSVDLCGPLRPRR